MFYSVSSLQEAIGVHCYALPNKSAPARASFRNSAVPEAKADRRNTVQCSTARPSLRPLNVVFHGAVRCGTSARWYFSRELSLKVNHQKDSPLAMNRRKAQTPPC